MSTIKIYSLFDTYQIDIIKGFLNTHTVILNKIQDEKLIFLDETVFSNTNPINILKNIKFLHNSNISHIEFVSSDLINSSNIEDIFSISKNKIKNI